MAPFEFKTGKSHHSHAAQVMLYLLLMEERYGVVIERGLLQYLNDQPPQVLSCHAIFPFWNCALLSCVAGSLPLQTDTVFDCTCHA